MKKTFYSIITFVLLFFVTPQFCNAQQISLNSMEGKHYKTKSLLVDDFSLPLEGDICIIKEGIILVLGDGMGYPAEFHFYEPSDRSNTKKWTISGDNGNGFIEIFPQYTEKNKKEIMLKIVEGAISNTYILENTPFDHPTLKQ